jgi:hypothetical protein
MTDGHKSFIEVGSGFAKHDTVIHSELEFARGIVHVNHAEGFNDRVRRTVVGVFHHISQKHVQLYFDEIGFRWRQRIFRGEVNRSTKSGRVVARKIWDRKSAGEQMQELLAGAVGRQGRRSPDCVGPSFVCRLAGQRAVIGLRRSRAGAFSCPVRWKRNCRRRR